MPFAPGLLVAAAVALLAEGVDRNCKRFYLCLTRILVALLAEGVDRNISRNEQFDTSTASPSSRRAWIEIIIAK